MDLHLPGPSRSIARCVHTTGVTSVVATHPFWDTVDKDKVVEARMALKHAHETPDDHAAA